MFACGNSGNVIDNSGENVTVKEGNLTAADYNVCIGYVTNLENREEQIKAVYFVNLGAKKTETPAA